MGTDGGLRPTYTGSRFAHLDWCEFADRPVEVVAAASASEDVDIWRVCHGLEQGSFESLRAKLQRVFKSHYPMEEHAVQCCDQALFEYLSPNCRRCRNAETTINLAGRLLSCPRCNGSGVERYTDERRAGMMKVSTQTAKYLAPKVARMLGWLGSADRQVNRDVGRYLGR